MHQARAHGMAPDDNAWRVQAAMMNWLEGNWREPDEGIWEVRGGRNQFTHSKVMAWVAFDRAVKAVEQHGLGGDAARWRGLRAEVHEEVCAYAVDDRGAFTQSFGGTDARCVDTAHPARRFPSGRRPEGGGHGGSHPTRTDDRWTGEALSGKSR